MTILTLINDDASHIIPSDDVAAATLPTRNRDAENALYWRTRCLSAEAKIQVIDFGTLLAAVEWYADPLHHRKDADGKYPVREDAGKRARLALEAIRGNA